MGRALSIAGLLLGAGVLCAGVLAAVRWGLSERAAPARCPVGLAAMGPRCCAPGQHHESGRCAGAPARCPAHMVRTDRGCVARPFRVGFAGGRVEIGPDDWQSAGVRAHTAEVAPFSLDAHEVTHDRWQACVRTADCRALELTEPGVPVTGVTPRQAMAFCRFAGGRLPTGPELWMAARGLAGRRFPWGPTGLVCRRASYGLVEGPCAEGAASPELAGARPDGRTPEGVYDLAGNVAELAQEDATRFLARGGSFRSRLARELTIVAPSQADAARDVGFRCAYGGDGEG